MNQKAFPLTILFLSLLANAFSYSLPEYENIPYVTSSEKDFSAERHLLNVYTPAKTEKNQVMIFIHGGKWQQGQKDQYRFYGRGLALKGKIAVVINYRLWPEVSIDEMTQDCAKAVQWVYHEIEKYGGDKNNIYISGHSSGAHLAALLAVDSSFFDALKIPNPIKGCVLIDPFGLNLSEYLTKHKRKDAWMYKIFSEKDSSWQKITPANYIRPTTQVKFFTVLGGSTREIIWNDGVTFHEKLLKLGLPSGIYTSDFASHLVVMFQMHYRKHKVEYQIVDFMNEAL